MNLKQRTKEINTEIAGQVLAARFIAKMSQIEFSKLLGISQPHLSKIENGIAFMTAAQYVIMLDLISKMGEKK